MHRFIDRFFPQNTSSQKKFYCLLILLFCSLFFINNARSQTLDLNISNIKYSGQVCIMIFQSPDTFHKYKKDGNCLTSTNNIFGYTANVKSGKDFNKKINLAKGTYAIKVFLDKNHNAKLDYFLGFAKESFGYSNNPETQLGFNSPYFSEIEFALYGARKLEIKL